jgi:cytochrome c biogenesis protein CcdA
VIKIISLFVLSFLFLLFVFGIIASILIVLKSKTDDFHTIFYLIIVICFFGSLSAFRDVLEKAESIDLQILEKTEKNK